MAQAVSYLLAKKVSRIILARPAVEAGEKLGFLPGDLQEKVNPYLRPLYDALYDMMEVEKAERLLERGTIEVAPIAFMRGRTLNDAFVILDEAQNTTPEQMKMFLTRLGFGSKAVVTGDITQIDLPSGRTSGLVEAMHVVGNVEGIDLRVLRRARRRPAQARAGDREGLRGARASVRRSPPGLIDSYASWRPTPPPARLHVTVATPDDARDPRARAGQWLERVAPATARGRGRRRARQRRAHARAQPLLPREGLRDRRAVVSRRRDAGGRAGARRHRDCHRRREPAGGTRPDMPSRPNCACWRCTGCCTCSATITSATTARWRGSRHGFAGKAASAKA